MAWTMALDAVDMPVSERGYALPKYSTDAHPVRSSTELCDHQNVTMNTTKGNGGPQADGSAGAPRDSLDPPRSEAQVRGRGGGSLSEWITLNVGGRCFMTTRGTLVSRDPDSMLARMFALTPAPPGGGGAGEGEEVACVSGGQWNSTRDERGAYLIDRSPTYFEPILNYLRGGELVLDGGVSPRGVLGEARFYGLTSLIAPLEASVRELEPPSDATPLTRRFLVERLIGTPPDWELRCQGLNFEGTNLSKLDLRHVNFKYANLRRANLCGANLSYCNLERADMWGARLDGANLLGAKMLCVNLEGASMRGCNFEDPAGTRANMEGASMKHVDLEGSRMAAVNLRVATLKNANLQNCDLRGAVLAGADLENCDLSGCDLQEANLRGANLKDAAFELMVNPVHMSQAVR